MIQTLFFHSKNGILSDSVLSNLSLLINENNIYRGTMNDNSNILLNGSINENFTVIQNLSLSNVSVISNTSSQLASSTALQTFTISLHFLLILIIIFLNSFIGIVLKQMRLVSTDLFTANLFVGDTLFGILFFIVHLMVSSNHMIWG